ncbi:hypothetical protein ACFPFX_18890 [Streptomyces mauvecolor]|uniref:Transposase n=1 Tax=Streptomyces mauvecolor TaxID=58345 RepID=A0ABV9UPE3_9ACTN
MITRYAWRWSIEVTFAEARDLLGTGQARNRTRHAIERTVPFGLYCYTITVVWYALHGHHPSDAAEHRAGAPSYTTKTAPSVADMAAKLRRTVTAADFCPTAQAGPPIRKSAPSSTPGPQPAPSPQPHDHADPPERRKSRSTAGVRNGPIDVQALAPDSDFFFRMDVPRRDFCDGHRPIQLPFSLPRRRSSNVIWWRKASISAAVSRSLTGSRRGTTNACVTPK